MRLRHFVLDGNGKPLVGCCVEAVLEFKAPEKLVKTENHELGPSLQKGKAAAKSTAAKTTTKETKPSHKPSEPGGLDMAKLMEAGLAESETGDGETTPKRDLQLVLGKTRTDRCGYGVIDLGRLPKGSRNLVSLVVISVVLGGKGDLRLRVRDGAGSVSLLDGSLLQLLQAGAVDSAAFAALVAGAANAQDARAALMAMLEEALAERTDAFTLIASPGTLLGPAGHVLEPDATDYAFSPDSFVSRRDVMVGADGCEHLTPATLALRQYPIYHVVVHDEGKAIPVGSHGEPKAASAQIPSVRDPLIEYRDIRWGRILEFDQSWSALGHSLGEVKYSLPLAPGEAVKIAVIDWKRSDAASRLGANAASDQLLHEQAVDRDIDEIVSGNVSEQQSGETFMAGLAGAMDFQLPQFGISAAGRHSLGFGMSSTRGNRDVSAQAQNSVHLQTVQRSNLVRSQSSSVVVQATQAESNYLATRIIANMNRGHSLTVLYYEVLRHLAVRTRFRRADMAVLIPVETIYFTQDLAARFRSQLEPALLNSKYAQGFEALERINAGIGDAAPPVSAPPAASPPPAPSGPPQPVMATQFEVTLKTGWRWNGQKYTGPADTAGHLRVIARMSDGSNKELVRLDEFLFPVVANFAHIFDFAGGDILGANNKRWTVSYDSPQRGFCFATCTGNIPAIDLRKVQSFAVEWTPNSNLVVDVGDGWNLQEVSIRPMLQSGAFLFGYFQFTNSTGELFRYQAPPRIGLPVPTQNQGVALINTDKLNPAPEPAPTPTPAATPAPATPASSTSPSIDSHQWVRLLMHHLNTNQHYYSAQVWLNMDARERRLRLAPSAGPLLAGLGEVPLALSGNHLAFRYAGDVPSEVAARLPELKVDLKASETVVTLPTRGIFAEAHLGHCNAAEKRDITRLWNFEELPVSLLPNIEALTAGPRGTQATVTPDTMGDTPLTVQDTPVLPAAGEAIAKALELLAKPDIFRDQSTREQVAEIMGKLIESAQPPKLSGSNIGSAIGGGSSPAGKTGGTGGSSGGASSAEEGANPFDSQAGDTGDGGSFLAERYRNYRLTDDSDRFQLAPELAKSLSGSGMSQDKVDDVVSTYVKGTSGVVKKVPATPAQKRVVVSLDAWVDVQNGVKRALNGEYTLTFSPPGDQQDSPPTGARLLVSNGSNSQRIVLPPDVYTVRARYVASKTADLAVLREPQRDSLGVNGQAIVNLAMDMLQRDLAGQMTLKAEIRARHVTVDSKTTHVALVLKAEIVPSPVASAEIEFTQGTDFSLDNENKVAFDSGKLAELAALLFEKIKIPQAGAVASILSLLTIESSIGANGHLKVGSSGKVLFKFTPYILRDIWLDGAA